ncbi:Type IV fimbrial biogenesis protein PilY1 [Labilithrix luteola]|uniref:Type IV fimbrial biogenesis protein PilY1 n=1 Tax=Labilithrix luteola TaxID=1391654 RepID=A0A0K1PJZ3_9BACT|nr:hypothetical protein [Labilithrix luteola]AKU93863.1 Type IV fimbrial biogenesis protein PilY1 [Labilithrix luteola]
MRTSKPLLLASALATPSLLLGLSMASCATSSDSAAPAKVDVVPDVDSSTPGFDASSDGSPDAGCESDSGNCTTKPLDCSEADFCDVPTNVDLRYSLTSVWGSSANDVWAVGSGGTIVHWNGTAWTGVDSGRKETFNTVWGSSATDVWIGAAFDVILRTTGVQGSSTTFTRVGPVLWEDPMNFSGTLVNSLWGANGEVFVGTDQNQRNAMWRHHAPVVEDPDYPPSEWETVGVNCESPGVRCFNVNGVWGASASDIWAVTSIGTVRHATTSVADGGTVAQWQSPISLTTAALRAVWGSSANDVWFVGEGGTIRRFTNDGSGHLLPVESPTTETLRAIWGSAANDVWIVGDSGTILHWDGTSLKKATAVLPVGAKPRLSGVWGSSANDVWIVGQGGIALHYTGPKPPPTTAAKKEGAR